MLLGFAVLLMPEGAPLGEKLTLGVGFGLGVDLPVRSSEAIAHGKWQDQACVESTTQIYVRSTTIHEKPLTVHNRTDRGMVERLYRGAPCIVGMLLTEVVPGMPHEYALISYRGKQCMQVLMSRGDGMIALQRSE